MSTMLSKMFFVNKSRSSKYLLLLMFLDLGVLEGFCMTTYVQTEIKERLVIPTIVTESYSVNNSLVSLREDFTLITHSDTFHLPDSKVRRDVTEIFRTYSGKSLDVNYFTSHGSSVHENDVTSQMDQRNKSEARYEVTKDQCLREKVITFSGEGGIIYIDFSRKSQHEELLPYCILRIVVPQRKYAQVTLEHSKQMEKVVLLASEDPNFRDPSSTNLLEARSFPFLISGSNQIFFRIAMFQNISEFMLRFSANEKDLQMMLPVINTSPTSGYVTTWGFDDDKRHSCFMNASRTVRVPLNHVVMVSFSHVDIHCIPTYLCNFAYIRLYELVNNVSVSLNMEICINAITPALVLNRSFEIRFFAKKCQGRGFKMIFTFHPDHEAPVRRDGDLWDCSVPHYNTFKQHLECNLMPECQGGEDEGPHCPYSSLACNGSVDMEGKCYFSFKPKEYLTWSSASRVCRNQGGYLANVKTETERNALKKIYQFEKSPVNMYIGLSTYDGTLPPEYKKVLVWSDGTAAYDHNYYFLKNPTSVNVHAAFCFAIDLQTDLLLEFCTQESRKSIPLCEFSVTNIVPQMSVLMPLVNSEHVSQIKNSHYVWCPDGHFTFDFLSCDKTTQCGAQLFPLHCHTRVGDRRSVVTAMFVCLDYSSCLPYSLVCDFKPDCQDGSDENFCRRDYNCAGFTCFNGQCIDPDKLCDVNEDCWDGSDEECDMFQSWLINMTSFAYPPAVIDFGQKNDLMYKALNVSDACPDTHFRCPPDGYCLPIYVRCNGVYDCPYHEDEEDCVSYTCPGFYRCRASSVCVHVDHMCDGRPQCPQHDDELFCELTCPQGCLCQGLAFVCSVRFNTHTFPAMRYLDARGSGMATSDLAPSVYLAWLSLASCNIQVLTNMSLPSLQTLDLSNNLVIWLDMSYFSQFENLRVLRLAGNPLLSLFASDTPEHSLLTQLDVSRTMLTTFECDVSSVFSEVQALNLSFTLVVNLSWDCFRSCQKLTELDMRGNNVKQIHSKTLRNLTSLQTVYVGYYTLCCKEILPNTENLICSSPSNSFSSCQNLLRLKSLFVVLWFVCVACLAGNVSCAIYKIFIEKEKINSISLSLMINLNVSDLGMGLYLFVVGTADVVYRDSFLWYEQSWTGGYFCQLAGLLYFVSMEASIITLFLMTIERLCVIKFRAFNFRGCLLPVVFCCIWIISLVLALIPFLPFINQRDLYRQNSVCAPLPVYNDGFVGWPYLFAVVVGLNLVLILTADILYVGSICSLPACISNHSDRTRKDKTLARRLTLLLVTKTVSCLLLTAIGVTTHLGTSYPPDVISNLTLLVGPLNASLNPLLYGVSVSREASRKSQRMRLLKVLQSRCQNSHNSRILSIEVKSTSFIR